MFDVETARFLDISTTSVFLKIVDHFLTFFQQYHIFALKKNSVFLITNETNISASGIYSIFNDLLYNFVDLGI